MRKIILFIFILNASFSFSQIKQYFFVDDVELIKHLYVNICIGANGETLSVTEIPEKTTYHNKKEIQKIIDYRKGFDFLKGSKYSNSCFEYRFLIVNSKYKSKESITSNCVSQFQKGRYQFINSEYNDTKVIRRKRKQIEKGNSGKLVFKIEWVSNCNYVLTYLKVTNPDYEYLIGQKIDVRIIDILENGDYVYYSNLADRTFIFGQMRKI